MTIHLFSGYIESDLTTKTAINAGDQIRVPDGDVTRAFQVVDDDANLEGDTISPSTADDHTQIGKIFKDGQLEFEGNIYVDAINVVEDASGNKYTLYEIELEGTDRDYYAFASPPPPPDTELTVVSHDDANADRIPYELIAGDDQYSSTRTTAETVSGGAGSDSITTGSGSDSINTGSGADTIDSGAGDDKIDGGTGSDLIHGGSGDDYLLGGDGSDVIYGGTGDDTILGGAGDDHIHTGPGADQVDGGQGSDYVYLHHEDDARSNTLIDSGTNATETDRIILDGGTVTYRVQGDFSASSGFEIIDGRNARGEQLGTRDDRADFDFTDVTLIGVDEIIGTENTDKIIGSVGHDTINGFSGNDHLDGGRGDDIIYGGAGNDRLTGGEGNDVLTGGLGNDVFEVSEGIDRITDFGNGNSGTIGDGIRENNDFIDLSKHYDSLGELRGDIADDGLLNQSNAFDDEGRATDYSDNKSFGTSSLRMENTDRNSFSYDNTGIICFLKGTMISTPKGETPVERLRVGDLVSTLDNGMQPIAWIGSREVSKEEMAAQDELRPVLISEGVFGATRKLFVSRHHALLIHQDFLASAGHVSKHVRGVRVAHGKRKAVYFHIMLSKHEVIFSNGVPSESFYPVIQAMRMLEPKCHDQLLRSFPDLKKVECEKDIEKWFGPRCRPMATQREIPGLHAATSH
ncbi:Hint domain-containing protein [Maritimibacter alexandrii]|uniref:Hint domain-containing protein n=1 Tax=Maritimibacter alexandrii TaxID=2570355 RepID=UPI001107EF5E|nr:Hint domain-containing protein [Maritimibacter alexandrii]